MQSYLTFFSHSPSMYTYSRHITRNKYWRNAGNYVDDWNEENVDT